VIAGAEKIAANCARRSPDFAPLSSSSCVPGATTLFRHLSFVGFFKILSTIMQFAFALLAAFVSAAVAAPTNKRQASCQLDRISALTVVAAADPNGKTRWDVFASSSELVQEGDLGWFVKDEPDQNEIFTAKPGPQSDLFTFQTNGVAIGVSGSELHPNGTAATFKVSCGRCNDFATSNDLAADGCTFELTDGTDGVGQCMTFEAANSVVQLQGCQSGSLGQTFEIFSAS
jgi:acyl-CoA synthetase (AMP-forming)/AMP-acid ligase II